MTRRTCRIIRAMTRPDPAERPASTPRRLGLTGSIGAGKSTASRHLRDLGFTVLDADAVARELGHDPDVLRAVTEQLGPQYVTHDGPRPALDRPALAALVFSDPERRSVLNGILHPRVRAELARQEALAARRGETWVVQDVPLLFEGGAWRDMDAVLLVDAPLDTRVRRVMARDGLTRDAVLARDAAQMPVLQKLDLMRGRPGVLLDNGHDEAALVTQLRTALRTLGVLPD